MRNWNQTSKHITNKLNTKADGFRRYVVEKITNHLVDEHVSNTMSTVHKKANIYNRPEN